MPSEASNPANPINLTPKFQATPARSSTNTTLIPIRSGNTSSAVLRTPHRGIQLSLALKKKVTMPDAILPGLLYEGQSTFVRVSTGIEAQWYANSIALAVAGGLTFSPYGTGKGGPVMFVYGLAAETRVLEQSTLLIGRIKSADTREKAVTNLSLYRVDLDHDDDGCPVSSAGRSMFDHALPPGCKLVVFFDIARCLRRRTCSNEDFRQLGELLNDLNHSGIATLVFYRTSKKTDAAFSEELLADCDEFTLELTPDRSAPREYGAGFAVKRRKVSEHDTVPTNFQVWYTVMDNVLNFGWECRSPDDRSNDKQIEIAERQKRVADLLNAGMQQKKIAAELGVNSATVSRDASRLKAKANHTPKGPAAPTATVE
jgi:hypothetical protein